MLQLSDNWKDWPPEAKVKLLERLKARASTDSAFIPHRPTPRQQLFLELNDLEAFYGGAAGGGKTDALLMAALQYVDVPGYSALLLMKSFSDLSKPGALMDRAHEWLQGS